MERLRTFGIVAHVDAGKTTLTERILHAAGVQRHVGSVDDGTAATDWLPQERARGISITAAVVRATWSGARLQIVDTPGHVDFTAEVERCFGVLDAVVVVVDGVRGIETRTAALWREVARRRLPALVFVNKLDRPGADAAAVAQAFDAEFACRTVPLVVPLADAAGRFAGLGCARTGAVQWFAGQPDPAELPRLAAAVRAAHERLVERLADVDTTVFAAVVEGRVVSAEQLGGRLQRAVQAGLLVPVLAGAALHGQGIDWLLDAVVGLGADSAAALARRAPIPGAGDAAAPFAGQVFKVQHFGAVWNFVRVLRGRLVPGMPCGRSARPEAVVAVAELLAAHADRHRALLAAEPGEIVVLPGEMGLRTGETVFALGAPVQAPEPEFPAPVLAQTFEPEQADAGVELLAALREVALDDPTLRVDREYGQIVVRGMGELHLDVVADQVAARCPQPFRRSPVRVDVRRTVNAVGSGRGEARAFVAGGECGAVCRIAVAPAAGTAGAAVSVAATGAPAAAVAVAVAALGHELRHHAGGPLVGAAVEILGLAVEGGALVEALVEQAAVRALGQALADAGITELEPWVMFEIHCPEASCQAVVADLGARGAELHAVAAGQLGARLQGTVPLRRMLGYVTRLRSITRGGGWFEMRPVAGRPVPR
jgi:elongation factor G